MPGLDDCVAAGRKDHAAGDQAHNGDHAEVATDGRDDVELFVDFLERNHPNGDHKSKKTEQNNHTGANRHVIGLAHQAQPEVEYKHGDKSQAENCCDFQTDLHRISPLSIFLFPGLWR
jgi:hypothetical protein